MKKLEPHIVPHLLGEWLHDNPDRWRVPRDVPWLLLFGDEGEPTQILTGDDARLFAWGKSELPQLKPSSHIFYDPYDMPEWFYFSWYELDIFALLVQHAVLDPTQWQRGELPRSWGSKI